MVVSAIFRALDATAIREPDLAVPDFRLGRAHQPAPVADPGERVGVGGLNFAMAPAHADEKTGFHGNRADRG